MKIIDKKREVNFSQWIKMAKGRNGLNLWVVGMLGVNAHIA